MSQLPLVLRCFYCTASNVIRDDIHVRCRRCGQLLVPAVRFLRPIEEVVMDEVDEIFPPPRLQRLRVVRKDE